MDTLTKLDLSRDFKIATDTLSKTLKEEEVLLNLDSGTYFGLDEVGTFIWQQLKTSTSGNSLAQSIISEFEVDPEIAKNDLQGFLSKLLENGLVEYST